MKTFTVATLGCKVNQAETEKIIGRFLEAGFELVDSFEKADVSIINTCTVTAQADHKSRQAIRRARRNQDAFVVATGCGVVTESSGITSIQGIDLLAGNRDKEELVTLVRNRLNGEDRRVQTPAFSKQHLHTRALVKVQDGCDHFCSFCIVPFVRGKPASKPASEILAEVEGLVNAGVKEIVITGVNLGKYGADLNGNKGLVGLLENILRIDPLGRVRLSSIEVNNITPKFVSLFGRNPKLCHHLHIPLQSGSNRILQAMNRGYKAEEYLGKISQLKAVASDVALTTDVMVGFPGETDEDFEATRSLIEKTRFRKLHVFKFSPRPGTPAAELPDQMAEEVKDKRSSELIKLGDELAKSYLSGFAGREIEVLVEKKMRDGLLTGISDNYIRVCFEGSPDLVGELVTVRTTEAKDGCLYGELIR